MKEEEKKKIDENIKDLNQDLRDDMFIGFNDQGEDFL